MFDFRLGISAVGEVTVDGPFHYSIQGRRASGIEHTDDLRQRLGADLAHSFLGLIVFWAGVLVVKIKHPDTEWFSLINRLRRPQGEPEQAEQRDAQQQDE